MELNVFNIYKKTGGCPRYSIGCDDLMKNDFSRDQILCHKFAEVLVRHRGKEAVFNIPEDNDFLERALVTFNEARNDTGIILTLDYFVSYYSTIDLKKGPWSKYLNVDCDKLEEQLNIIYTQLLKGTIDKSTYLKLRGALLD